MIALRAGSATDVGLVRTNNQDQFLMADRLYAVADGMGGAAAGEIASAIAVEALRNGFVRAEAPTSDHLIEAAQAANRAVWDEAEANPEMRGMGTTLVAVALVEGPELAIINIGDSRLYAFRGDELRQVTRDHNLVAEMVDEGRISPEEAEVHPRRNIMTRALGVEPEVPIDLFMVDPRVGDRYMLCSDGLPREVGDDLISAVLRRLGDPHDAARELVEEAKRRGGNDNITVVVVDVVDSADLAGRPDGEEATTAIPVAAPPEREPEEPPAAEPPAREPAATGRSWWRRRGARARGARVRGARVRGPRAVNLRVVAFMVLLLAIIGAGAFGVVWYARSSYFVGLEGSKIVIYEGRPGGVLWFQPTLAETTRYSTADVLPVNLPTLHSGQEEATLEAARAYVQNLVDQRDQAQAAGGSAPTAPATSTPSTTGAVPAST